MVSLQWSTSHAVFVTEIDDEHKEIFDEVSQLQTERLAACLNGHFAHEERLMRAARYTAVHWHQRSHRAARRRIAQFVERIKQGDAAAGSELAAYLTAWLPDHAGVADRMMGAALRNQQRGMWTMTFRAGTKPMDACAWVGTNGEAFDPGRGCDGR
jgi:hemerythrin-like metal-binding protein